MRANQLSGTIGYRQNMEGNTSNEWMIIWANLIFTQFLFMKGDAYKWEIVGTEFLNLDNSGVPQPNPNNDTRQYLTIKGDNHETVGQIDVVFSSSELSISRGNVIFYKEDSTPSA